jgi:D-alanyl-D-alanine carboxypeptidase
LPDLAIRLAEEPDLPALNHCPEGPGQQQLKLFIQQRVLIGIWNGQRVMAMSALDLEQQSIAFSWFSSTAQQNTIGPRLLASLERLAARYLLLQLYVAPKGPKKALYTAHGYVGSKQAAGKQQLCRRFPRRQTRYGRSIARQMSELGVPQDYGQQRYLPLQTEARQLRTAGKDIFKRPARMTSATASAWTRMRAAARADGETLQLVSAFRSPSYQAGIVRRKLEQGQNINTILEVSAAPGFSEHHTGRALDLTTTGEDPLETSFEHTSAYGWLLERAAAFGFRQSYPRGNIHGIAFEPWHWFYERGISRRV